MKTHPTCLPCANPRIARQSPQVVPPGMEFVFAVREAAHAAPGSVTAGPKAPRRAFKGNLKSESALRLVRLHTHTHTHTLSWKSQARCVWTLAVGFLQRPHAFHSSVLGDLMHMAHTLGPSSSGPSAPWRMAGVKVHSLRPGMTCRGGC